jgi:hypothetical protein
MTGSWRACVAIARPNAPRIPGLEPDDTQVSGTPGLRFRTIADMIAPARHTSKDTANAVGLYGPPGFKSPILRHLSSSYARALSLGGLRGGLWP